jgi:hypothetical protein
MSQLFSSISKYSRRYKTLGFRNDWDQINLQFLYDKGGSKKTILL